MFKFSNYTLRAAEESDREHLAAWLARDPQHQDSTPDFFLKPEPGAECFVLLDRWGGVKFYFKMERALRVHIQFGPATTDEERKETREALHAGFGWLTEMGRKAGFRQIIFDSAFAPLIRFVEKRLGFKKSPNELVCGITHPATPAAAEIKEATIATATTQERQTSHVRSH